MQPPSKQAPPLTHPSRPFPALLQILLTVLQKQVPRILGAVGGRRGAGDLLRGAKEPLDGDGSPLAQGRARGRLLRGRPTAAPLLRSAPGEDRLRGGDGELR